MRNPKTKASKWPKVRKFLNDIHLWGGLISGIVVFIVCLTGTIYTYNTELREAALSEFHKVSKSGEKKSPDALLAKARSEIKGKIVGIKIPFAEDRSTFILYNKLNKNEEQNDHGRGRPSPNQDHASDKLSAQKDSLATKNIGAEAGKKAAEQLHSDRSQGDALASPTLGKQEVAARPQQGRGRGPRFNQMAVNPYTGEVIGDPSDVKTQTAAFMQKMFGLHRWLLLNEIEKPLIDGVENRKLGSWITGTATLLFLLGILTGMIIWFPKKMRSWKKGLNIRWNANWKRVNHDLHNTLGFYSFILLFLMSVTGPFWSFEWYRAGWQKTWGTYQDSNAPQVEKPQLLSFIPLNGQQPLTIEQTLTVVKEVLPYDGDVMINFATDRTGTINVTKNRVGFFAPSAGDKLVLDQYAGTVLEKDIFREKPFNQRAAASIKALHIGDIYGPFSKLLYFIACLIATSLPVTGVLIWVNKMKKKPKNGKGTARERTVEYGANINPN